MSDLSVRLFNMELKNPLMPAAGPLTGDYEKIKYIADLGVGAMVTKTISTVAADVPRPCIYGGKDFVMNAELWSELPPEEWTDNILPKVKDTLDIPVIVSAGYTVEDMKVLIPKLDKFADAFEISTHYVGKDLKVIEDVVKAIRDRTEKPILMKMSPHIPDPVGFAQAVKENGGNGVVAINSLGPTLFVDAKNRVNTFGGKDGYVWISGPVIKHLALALVNMIKTNVPDITVIGVGGIRRADDIIEFLLAGADAVQMLSSALIMGKDLYKTIINALPKTLQKYGFSSIQDVINSRMKIKEITYTPSHPVIDYNKCTYCKVCEWVCPYFAIFVDKENKKITLYEDKCFGCGLCESRCPVHAISGIYSEPAL